MPHRRATRLHIRSRLLAIALLMLLPLLLLGGSMAGSAQADARPQAPGAQSQEQRPETLVLRVYFNSTAERDLLASELGPEETDTRVGYLTVFGDRAMYDSLRARGIRVEIDDGLTKAANTPILFGNTFYGGYFTVEEMQAFLDQKVAAYPTLAEKVDAGDSWCKTHPGQCIQPQPYNGYDIWAMRITNRNIPGPKPVFWFVAGIHSREIATPEVAMRYISWLLDNYNTNADARWLVDHHDIWVVPMSNPDGHHIVEAGGNSPYTHRKNADRDDGCTTWPPTNTNQFGVDLNRNFPFLWNCCGGSSGSPCSLTYRGPVAASEEETQSVTNMVRALIPDQRGPNNNDPAPLLTTGIYLDMHSTGNLNLYPWGWGSQQAPNHNDLANIARHMSAPNAGGNNYEDCQAGPCLYATDGASDDWAYGELGAPAYTIELSGGTFFPQYTQVENIWNENRGTLTYMAKIARTPYLTTRGPDANTVATNPMTVTQGMQSQLTGTINYAWTGNRYNQNVAAAEYYIDTPPWAGGVPAPLTPTDGQFDSPTEGVQATIDTTSIPPGRHVVFVRGRGVNDYEGNQSWGPITATWLVVTPGGGTPTPVATSTATSTANSTPTSTIISTATQTGTVAPTPTVSTCCGRLSVGMLASCNVNTATGNPNFEALVEIVNPCSTPVTVQVKVVLQVSPDSTTWANWAESSTRTVTVPPGPTPYSVRELFTDQSIPSQYQHYRFIGLINELSYCREYFPGTSPQPICRGSVTPTMTPATPCAVTFRDVPSGHTFHDSIRCLACRTIISGYADGTFKPDNLVTRSQLAKIVSNAANFTENPGAQIFQDVPTDHTFYEWINRLTNRGYMSGYSCGNPGEPCVQNRPYFRPFANATRAQTSKIVSNAARYNDLPTGQTFEDVPPTHPFYTEIQRLAFRNIMGGYNCGGTGEPCVNNRPYFRPYNDVTRGQSAKIVANTFYPNCQTP